MSNVMTPEYYASQIEKQQRDVDYIYQLRDETNGTCEYGDGSTLKNT